MERCFRTARLQLLPTLQPEDLKSLDALNRRLWAWVEGEYHGSPHRGLEGATPADRWAMCSDEVQLPSSDPSDLFLFEQKRRVHADRTVSLDGVAYEVHALLVGETVTLRCDPARPPDLLVPASVSPGTGRRAARLPGHDTRAARIVRGLDGAIVYADMMKLAALEEDDARTLDVRVAGPAALLVAKVHKIDDRKDSDRQSDKDALDVLRLLRGTETDDLAARYAKLLTDKRSEEAARRGREFARGAVRSSPKRRRRRSRCSSKPSSGTSSTR